jgi:septum site-determining protein MinD
MPAMKKPRRKQNKLKLPQGRVLVVTSGKGGVGKTTSTAALGAALAQSGQKVVLIDFDVGLRNLDLIMGAERRVVYDLINVINGDAKLAQALIRDRRSTHWLSCRPHRAATRRVLPEKASHGLSQI